MKNIGKYVALLLLAGFVLTGCETETTPERKTVQHPDQQTPILRDNAYYARLRAYKKTKHKLAFGWFGSWNPANASKMATLNHAPDSMDIISIWSQWHSLTPAQMKDKEFVQKMKGTKVTYTIFAHEVPEEFLVDGEVTPEGLAAYAKAYAKDSMDKYQYDGIDLDYEPGFGGVGPLVGHDNENMKIFCQELSKWVGPASGTGRLLIIDGVPFALHTELAKLFDYGIVQAYYSYGYTDLQNRFNNAWDKGWKPEQYIFAEDFEKGWQNGGVNHRLRDGKVVPSLFGMALFDPDQGTGGGFGAYHMEYEYGHHDMVYKYMRQAIQLVNPAPAGDLTKTLVSINESDEMEHFEIAQTPSGHVYGEVTTEITGKLSVVPAADTDIKLSVDNDFVKAYNADNDTEYKTLDPAQVNISGDLHFAAGEQYTAAPVTISVPGVGTLENGDYMIVVKPDVAGSKTYGINEKAYAKVMIINKASAHIEVSVTGDVQQNFTLMKLIDNSIVGEVATTVGAKLSRPAITSINLGFVADNELVAAYNKKNSTDFKTIDKSKVTVAGSLQAAAGETEFTGTINVSVSDPDAFEMGVTMIALRPELSSLEDYQASESRGVKYLLINKTPQNIASTQNLEPFQTECSLVDNANNKLNWDMSIQNMSSVGGTGVWNFNSTKDMFDGSTSTAWFAIWGNYYSWRNGVGGRITLDMKNPTTVHTFFWLVNNTYSVKTISLIETSEDGQTWVAQNYGEVTVAEAVEKQQWFSFIEPVETRFIRFTVTYGYAPRCGMSEIEIWAPNN